MPEITAPGCIIGIGNPGDAYADTRHNAGIWLLERLVKNSDAELKNNSKLHGAHCKIQFNTPLHCFVSHTFMNNSGQAVAALSAFYKLKPQQLLVVHDELDLPLGSGRIKFGGGIAGHNGLRDIVRALGGCQDFWRLRLGVGRPTTPESGSSYLLRKPPQQDAQAMHSCIDRALQALPLLCRGDVETAQQLLHTSPDHNEEK